MAALLLYIGCTLDAAPGTCGKMSSEFERGSKAKIEPDQPKIRPTGLIFIE
jgi:hypothetical protein